jgi:hypothetical protein
MKYCCRCLYQPMDIGYYVIEGNLITPSCRLCSVVYSDTGALTSQESPKTYLPNEMIRSDGKEWFEKRTGSGIIIVQISKSMFTKLVN